MIESSDTLSVGQEQEPEYLKDLNPQQRQAVLHREGPILVFAGAGSGKTRVLTRRIAALVLGHGVSAEHIFAVTFTNKACEEMRARLRSLLGSAADRLWVSTFHSGALRILRRHATKLGYRPNFVVYDTDDSKKVIKEILKSEECDEKRLTPQLVLGQIDKAKNSFTSVEDFTKAAKTPEQRTLARMYELYQRKLLQSNAMDFGDLLVNVVILFRENPEVLRLYQEHFHYILVDEYQDTNMVQYEFVKLISAKRKNLLVVGDDDQSIYRFRGATVRNILEFEKDFPSSKVVKLEQNYRSTKIILNAANAVIESNDDRRPKKLWTSEPGGSPIVTFVGANEGDEASFVAEQIRGLISQGESYRDMAIFYRTNAQSRALEEALIEARIPYKIFGGLRFYDRKEIKDIIAYLRLIANPSDNQAFLRVVNTPPRGVGARTIEGLRMIAAQQSVSLLQAAVLLERSPVGKNKGISSFLKLIDTYREKIALKGLSEIVSGIVQDSGYGPKLRAMKDDDSQSRLENLKELEGIARSMESISESNHEVLEKFLDRVSLTSSDEIPTEIQPVDDETAEVRRNTVSLMTLHLAKGLEFYNVFLTGLEEGLLPHSRSIFDPDELAEERRLCYVGITRAMRKLYLTRAETRGMFSSGSSFGGSGYYREVSRFALSIPRDTLREIGGGFFSNRAWSDDSIEIDPDFLEHSRKERNFSVKSKPSQRPLHANLDFIKPAQALEAPFVAAPVEQLKCGVRVRHRSFGEGTIEAFDGDGDNKKAVVLFDQYPTTKKLVLKYARLALA